MIYDILNNKDMDELYDATIDYLRDGNDLDLDVVESIEDDKKIAKKVEEAVEIVGSVLELKAQKGRGSIFDSDRSVDKASESIARYVRSVVILEDRELGDSVSNREYDEAEDDVAKLDDLQDAIDKALDEEERRERRRDSGRGRDHVRCGRDRGGRSGRSNRGGRDRDRGGRSGRSGRDNDRGSRSRRGRGGDDAPERAQTQRRQRVVEEKPSREKAKSREQREEAPKPRQNKIRTVMASVADLEPTAYELGRRAVFNPLTHAAVLSIDGQSVTCEVLKLEECESVESYQEHELRQTKLNKTNSGEKIVPIVDFRKLPDINNEDEVKASPALIEVVPAIKTVGADILPTGGELHAAAPANAQFTVGRLHHLRHMPFPKASLELLEGASSINSFDGWCRLLVSLRDAAAENTDQRVCSLLMAYVHSANKQLTRVINDLIGIVMDPDIYVESFFDDYEEIMGMLRGEDYSDEYVEWGKLEKTFIRSYVKVIANDELENVIKEAHLQSVEDADVVESCTELEYLVVRTSGDIGSTIEFDNNSGLSSVEYKLMPELYTAAEKLIQYNVKNVKPSPILLVDGLGNKFVILSTGQAGAPVYIRRA